MLLAAPQVFRAPEGPAAREARRPHFVRRRASKPARALRSLRRPPHRRHCVAHVWLNASSRSPARPRRRPPAPRPGPAGPAAASGRGLWCRWCSGRRRARPPARLGGLTSFGAAPRSPPVPSGPSGALHTSGAGSLLSGSARQDRRLRRWSWSDPERNIAPADCSSSWHASAVKETSPLLG